MNWRELPPLNALRAFAALAETGSYTRAGGKLNVTHAAVSQQVRSLEDQLGVRLVGRAGRGTELTEEGMLLARELESGFSTIQQGIARLTAYSTDRPVQITMSPAFAVEWLMPRLSDFQQKHRNVTLLLNPTAEIVELKPGGIDVAIRYQDSRKPTCDLLPVLVSDMIVIGTPSLVRGMDLSDPASLVELPWLQELGTNEVADWLSHHGVVPDRPLKLNQMPGNLIMDAVRRGDGISYTARAFFQEDLRTGKVVELFSEPRFGIYHIETKPRPLRRAVKVFTDWLLSEAHSV